MGTSNFVSKTKLDKEKTRLAERVAEKGLRGYQPVALYFDGKTEKFRDGQTRENLTICGWAEE